MSDDLFDPIPVSETEIARLTRESNGRVLALKMTTRGAKLDWPNSRWALPLLAEWRGAGVRAGSAA